MRTRVHARHLLRALDVLLVVLVIGVTSTAAWQAIDMRADDARFRPPGVLVDVGGRRLHLVCLGSGEPTVLLEAGGTNSSVQFAHVHADLARQSRVCAYDRAGMGFSDPSPVAPTASALVADLEAMLDAARVPGPYVLVAGSAGGLTAELYARRHPERVAGLVMLDAVHGDMIDAMPDAGEALLRRALFGRLLAEAGILRFVDPYHLRELPPPERDLALAFKYRPAAFRTVHRLVAAQRESAAQLAAAPPLRSDVPLVVVVRTVPAEDDPRIEAGWRASQAAFAARSSRGELLPAHGAGHHIETDRPELVREAVERVMR